jgi:hypothetical protein
MSETTPSQSAAAVVEPGVAPSRLQVKLADLRLAGYLTLLFPAALLFLVIMLAVTDSNDDSPLLVNLGIAGMLGMLLGAIAGFVAIFVAMSAGDDLPDNWHTVRGLLMLAGILEAASPVLAIVAAATLGPLLLH